MFYCFCAIKARLCGADTPAAKTVSICYGHSLALPPLLLLHSCQGWFKLFHEFLFFSPPQLVTFIYSLPLFFCEAGRFGGRCCQIASRSAGRCVMYVYARVWKWEKAWNDFAVSLTGNGCKGNMWLWAVKQGALAPGALIKTTKKRVGSFFFPSLDFKGAVWTRTPSPASSRARDCQQSPWHQMFTCWILSQLSIILITRLFTFKYSWRVILIFTWFAGVIFHKYNITSSLFVTDSLIILECQLEQKSSCCL